MVAVLTIAGQQFKVSENQFVYVHRLDTEVGATLQLKEVLLIEDDKKIKIGQPTVSGAVVQAKVLEHLKGDKVIVFKKKRRKGYKKKNGHRQQFTKIHIESIKG